MSDTPLINNVDKIIRGIGIIFFFLFPLFYLGNTTEFTEYGKLVLIFITAVAFLILWGVRIYIAKTFVLVKTPFDLQFIFITLAFALASWFSVSRSNSFYGAFNIWHWTLVELLAFIIILYVLLSATKTGQHIQRLLGAFLMSSSVLALLVIGNYFSLFDAILSIDSLSNIRFLSVLGIDGFSPAGNSASTLYILFAALLVLVFKLIHSFKNRQMRQKNLVMETIIVLVVGFAFILWLSPFVPGMPSRLVAPRQLDWQSSWRIATSTIRDFPLFGVGVSNYSTAYNLYRPQALNETDLWTTTFHKGGNEYLTWLTTTGVVGLIVLVLFIVKLFLAAQNSFAKESLSVGDLEEVMRIRTPLIISASLIALLFLIVPSTIAMIGTFFLLLILWLGGEKILDPDGQVREISVPLMLGSSARLKNQTAEERPVLPLIIGGLLIIIACVTSYYIVKEVRSNVAFARSIDALAEGKPARDVYNAQRDAITLNPYRDTYRRAYANTNITVARVVAAEKGESLTDTEREDVIKLIQQSIREVRIITERLNASNTLNWQIRGRVYESLLGVANGADRWALHAYQQASNLAPQDPQLRVDIANLLVKLANTANQQGTQGEAPGEDIPTVPSERDNLLRASEIALSDALTLKPDFANAHFNLALLYEEAGRNDLALEQLQQTLALLPEGSADYQQIQEEIERIEGLIGAESEPTDITTPQEEQPSTQQ